MDKEESRYNVVGLTLIIGFFVFVMALLIGCVALITRSKNLKDTECPSTSIEETIRDGVFEDDGEMKFYVDGNVQTNTWTEDTDGKIYYTGVNGRISTGRVEIDGVTYYFNEDGSLYTGWKLAANHWYYFTRNGAVTGYQTIKDEYGNSYEYYFDDNGYLVTSSETPDGRVADDDGYLTDANEDTTNGAEELEGFEYSVSDNIAPGQLSGILISGKPAEFYMLSIAGETSGGQIIMGDRGRAYGLCQFDYRYDLVDFMRWAYSNHPELWSGFSTFISYSVGAEELVGNVGIQNAFITARQINYEAAISDELLFMRQRYWDGFQTALDKAGFNLSGRHIAVSAAMFSVNVNCGAQPDVFINNLSPEMTDIELICGTYKLRNTMLAEQVVGRYGRKGTTGRYLFAEPQMALDLYHGYTTIDTAKNYGHGVQWCKNIFFEAITTVAIPGSSAEWLETTSETVSEMETETLENADSHDDLLIFEPSEKAVIEGASNDTETEVETAQVEETEEFGPSVAITENISSVETSGE